MTANNVAGELIIKILADTDELDKGIITATNGMSRVDSSAKTTAGNMDRLEASTDDAARSMRDVAGDAKRASDANSDLADATDEVADAADDAADAQGKTAGSMQDLLERAVPLAGGLLGVSAALTAIATEGFKAQTQLDNALRVIAFGTGKIGADADGLRQVWSELNGEVVQSSDEVAAAVASLNTYWSVDGEQLATLSRAYLDFARVTGGDVVSQIDALKTIFKEYGVTVENQPALLEKFARIMQETGIKTEDLTRVLASGDRVFELLGKDAATAASMIGGVAKDADVSKAEEFVSALDRIASTLAAEFGNDADASKALKAMLDNIAELDDETAGIAMISEKFGISSQVAGRLVGAIRDGILDTSELDRLTSTGASMNELITATETLDDKMTLASKRITESFLPVGDALKQVFLDVEPALSGVGDAIAWIFDTDNGLKKLLTTINPLFKVFDRISEWIDKKGGVILEKLGAIGEKIGSIIGINGDGLKGLLSIAETVADFIGGTFELALDGLLILLSLLAGDTETAANVFESSFKGAFEHVGALAHDFGADLLIGALSVLRTLAETIENGMNLIISSIVIALNGLIAIIEQTANNIIATFENALNIAVDGLNALIDVYNTYLGAIGAPILAHANKFAFDRVKIDRLEVPEITALTDAIDTKISELEKSKTINQEVNITINAANDDSARDIAQKTSRQMYRMAGVM